MLKKKSGISPISATVSQISWNKKQSGKPQKLHGTITDNNGTRKINSPSVTFQSSSDGSLSSLSFTGSDGSYSLSADDSVMVGQFLSDNRSVISALSSRK